MGLLQQWKERRRRSRLQKKFKKEIDTYIQAIQERAKDNPDLARSHVKALRELCKSLGIAFPEDSVKIPSGGNK